MATLTRGTSNDPDSANLDRQIRAGVRKTQEGVNCGSMPSLDALRDQFNLKIHDNHAKNIGFSAIDANQQTHPEIYDDWKANQDEMKRQRSIPKDQRGPNWTDGRHGKQHESFAQYDIEVRIRARSLHFNSITAFESNSDQQQII